MVLSVHNMTMKIGRPKEFDTEKALNAAMLQFWIDGYEATSLQNLLKTMGLSKSSLYQTFGSKHNLFLSCIDNYQRTMVKTLNHQLDASPSGMDFIQAILLEIINEASLKTGKKGCLLVNTINELSQQDKQVAKSVYNSTAKLTKVFSRAIERCKQDGIVDPDSNTDTLANYLITNISGLRTMVKGGIDKKSLNSVVVMILKTLK